MAKIDDFIRRQGTQIPERSLHDPVVLSIEELVAEKERLEDLIFDLSL